MGLDIYVGSLTRYYSGQWETAVQRIGREQGLNVVTLRAAGATNAVKDVAEIRRTVLTWREQLSAGLAENITAPLAWDESDEAPYFSEKPDWNPYVSLLLWAAHAEHPDLVRPLTLVEEWHADPAFQRSSTVDSKTAFLQLMSNVEIWLPDDFSFTFRTADPNGRDMVFGSSVALCSQLADLNGKTWNATDDTMRTWRGDPPAGIDAVEYGARFAFAILTELSRQAVAHRLVMKLDY
jgi:hypothetical protein